MPRASVREQIVESALTEFHGRGFNGCSVEDITKGAGVPKGSFYNHFRSKEELGAEVVRRYTAASAFRAEMGPFDSPLSELRARFEAVRDRLALREYARGCLLVNLGAEVAEHSPLIRSEVETSLAGWSERVSTLLRAAIDAGEISPVLEPDQLSRLVLDAWEGAVTRAKIVRGPEPIEDFFSIVFDHLLR
jgi:TetR/AcrR family transcriptional repressor of nem operon